MVPLLLVLACAAPDPADPGGSGAGGDTAEEGGAQDSGAGGGTSGGTAGDEPLETDIPAPSLDAAGLAAAIEEAVADGMPNPFDARLTFLGLFEGRDPGCPGGENPYLPGNFGGCVSESGWTYAGVAEYSGSSDPDRRDDFTLLADAYVIDGDGARWVGAGNLEVELDAGGSSSVQGWSGLLKGTFSYAPAGGWQARPFAGGVLTYAVRPTDTSWELELEGSLAGGELPLVFEAIRVDGAGCAQPEGIVRVRDPSAWWYTVSLEDCGCGEAIYADGSSLGEVCVDLEAAMAGLVAP